MMEGLNPGGCREADGAMAHKVIWAGAAIEDLEAAAQ